MLYENYKISLQENTISTLLVIMHEHNPFEELHSIRVCNISKEIGAALAMPESDLTRLSIAGLLHDIGKITIDNAILNKPGKLTEEEWKVIKQHPEIGYRILNSLDPASLPRLSDCVLSHHEWYNGTGYPDGLSRMEIPLFSRIISLADAYDAMTSVRKYRNPLGINTAIEEIYKYKGIQFDPLIADVFIKKILEQNQ